MRGASASAVGLVLALLGAGACRPAPEPLATYHDWHDGSRGAVEADAYAAWRAVRTPERGETPTLLGEIERMLVTTRLAADATARGDDAVRPGVAEAEERVLLTAWRRHVTTEVEVSEEAIDAALAARPDAFDRPRLLQLRNLLVRVPEDAAYATRLAARVRAQGLRRRIESGEAFGAVARASSDSETAPRGGRLGWVDPEQLPEPVRGAARALDDGGLTPLLETPDGLQLLVCEGVREAIELSDAERRERTRDALRRAAEAKTFKEAAQGLLTEGDVEIDLASETPLHIEGRAIPVEEFLGTGPVRPTPTKESLGAFALRRLAAQRARALGLEADPEVANQLHWRRLEALARAELERRAEERLGLIRQDELRARYDAAPAPSLPGRVRASGIRLSRTRANARKRQREAGALRARLASGALSFEDAAREASDHASAAQGGSLGWLKPRAAAALGPRVQASLRSLEVGALSPVVVQGDALWILRVDEREPGRVRPFEEVAARLANQLRAEKLRGAREAAERELRDALEVELLDGAEARAATP